MYALECGRKFEEHQFRIHHYSFNCLHSIGLYHSILFLMGKIVVKLQKLSMSAIRIGHLISTKA